MVSLTQVGALSKAAPAAHQAAEELPPSRGQASARGRSARPATTTTPTTVGRTATTGAAATSSTTRGATTTTSTTSRPGAARGGAPAPTSTPSTAATTTSSPPSTSSSTTTGPSTPPADSSAPPPFLPAHADVQPVGQTGWHLRFSDEFDGSSLDTAKWLPSFPWGFESTTTPNTRYAAENVHVSDGTLKLRALPDPAQPGRHTSGMISSAGPWGEPSKFEFLYGYVEIQAKVPRGQGLWPAFWTLPPMGVWPPEIDVMENLGSMPNVHHMHLHYVDPRQPWGHGDDGMAWAGPDFSAGFHTFAVEWSPTAVRWFVDGVERRTAVTDPAKIPHVPMYLLATLQVGGAWPGEPDSTTVFPADFEIAYIRVWQRP